MNIPFQPKSHYPGMYGVNLVMLGLRKTSIPAGGMFLSLQPWSLESQRIEEKRRDLSLGTIFSFSR